ncbi:MAG TPA: helix-hairpin-helix domain-containing protein [Thermoanaerobaculia bacterium]|nr:helix-hairpin-helix domain-containing protein [Thermoanaerobaculia bacterium]
MFKNRRATASLLALCLALLALPSFAAEAPAQGKVNVNTATAEQLTLLPRVGPALAERILDFRKENGPFKKPEDLMLVRGIGQKSFELLAPYVTTSGETTLKAKVRSTRAAVAEG